MRIQLVVILFLVFGISYIARAQDGTPPKEPRILILLDGSSSMLQNWTDDEQRFSVASRIITNLIDSIYSVNDQVEFALRVYGHQSHTKDNNCFDTKKEVMFSKNNLTQMSLRLAALHPLGVSPIALSLQEAAENDMVNLNKYKYSLILITDGGESCGGDICTVVQELLQKKIDFKPYVLSLVDYAPLQKQYDCLGNFLLVTKENDIPNAVGKIVNAYRTSKFIQPIATPQQILQKATIVPPSALKVTIPKVTVTNSTTAVSPAPQPQKIEPKTTPLVDTLEVMIPATAKNDTAPPVVTPEPIRKSNIIVQDDPVKKIDTPAVAKADTSKPVQQVKAPDPKPKPPIEPIYKPIEPAATPPVAKTTPPVPAMPKKVDVRAERVEAKETTVKIFFTNGRGKFYESAPNIVISDQRTGKEVTRFQRTVDAVGNPRPQTIMSGTYKLTIPGKDNFIVENLEVRPDQENKFLITVNQASLRFEYNDPKNKAVVEYSAMVNKALQRSTAVTQKCTQELQYDPDNYHIVLNTLPRKQFNVDLEFDAIVTILLERPGYMQINNTNNLGDIELYYQHGDRFERFYTFKVNGNVSAQKLRLLPGPYKAIFRVNGNTPNPQEKVKDFFIKSDTITELYLQ